MSEVWFTTSTPICTLWEQPREFTHIEEEGSYGKSKIIDAK
jgi:hypothetical protein